MKYTVLGAGMMGSAVAYDLATTYPGDEVVLADINVQIATKSAKAIGPNVLPLRLDVNNGLAPGLINILALTAAQEFDEVDSIRLRATAFPASITARMLAQGTITARGVMPPERCVPGTLMIEELGKRNLKITKTVTETWS